MVCHGDLMTEDLHEIRTKAVDDFLKAVYSLQQQIDPVPTTLLASTLKISAACVRDDQCRTATRRDALPIVDGLEIGIDDPTGDGRSAQCIGHAADEQGRSVHDQYPGGAAKPGDDAHRLPPDEMTANRLNLSA